VTEALAAERDAHTATKELLAEARESLSDERDLARALQEDRACLQTEVDSLHAKQQQEAASDELVAHLIAEKV
jgi:hypothetical protein